MIRTLLTSTALVALLATGAIAQDNAAAPAANAAPAASDAAGSSLLTEGYQIVDTDGLASKLIGFPVYASAANDAERYGEINDIVIGDDGNVAAVLIGVGGFLGVGEKNVAVNYDELQWTTAEDNTERLVLETTKEALNAAPAVEMRDDQPLDTAATTNAPGDLPVTATDQPGDEMAAAAPADDAAANENQADVAASEQPAAQAQDENLQTGAISNPDANTPAAGDQQQDAMDPFDPANATAVDLSTLTAEDLKGTNVYGPENEHIGTIGDFVLAEDGKTIDAVIIDFGGFLGIGTKQVAVAYDNLDFYADQNNNRSLLLNVTREQMEQAPAFNRDTYSAERDTQRVVLDGAAS